MGAPMAWLDSGVLVDHVLFRLTDLDQAMRDVAVAER